MSDEESVDEAAQEEHLAQQDREARRASKRAKNMLDTGAAETTDGNSPHDEDSDN